MPTEAEKLINRLSIKRYADEVNGADNSEASQIKKRISLNDDNGKSFIKPTLESIEILPTGKKLLQSLNKHLGDGANRTFEVTFTKGIQTAAKKVNDNGDLRLDLSLFDGLDDDFQSTVPVIKNYVRIGDQDAFEISSQKSPFYLTMAHELIHLHHQIENKDEYEAYLKQLDHKTMSSIHQGFFHELNESREDKEELWPNLEERRTVLGSDTTDISELALRLEASEPIRYIYQDKTKRFFEPANTILNVFAHRQQDVIRHLAGLPQITANMAFENNTLTPKSLVNADKQYINNFKHRLKQRLYGKQ